VFNNAIDAAKIALMTVEMEETNKNTKKLPKVAPTFMNLLPSVSDRETEDILLVDSA